MANFENPCFSMMVLRDRGASGILQSYSDPRRNRSSRLANSVHGRGGVRWRICWGARTLASRRGCAGAEEVEKE
eukprot:9486692-Pyramimonas_sp.AAC.1